MMKEEDVKNTSEGWTEYQCIEILIDASRTRTRLGTLSNMMTNLSNSIINREELYHAIKIEDARIRYAKQRLGVIVNIHRSKRFRYEDGIEQAVKLLNTDANATRELLKELIK